MNIFCVPLEHSLINHIMEKYLIFHVEFLKIRGSEPKLDSRSIRLIFERKKKDLVISSSRGMKIFTAEIHFHVHPRHCIPLSI